jgi:hypothetical protein
LAGRFLLASVPSSLLVRAGWFGPNEFGGW